MADKFLTTVHKIENLHPTQFCVGQLEIDSKLAQYKNLSFDELDKIMRLKSVPLVLGPNNVTYMIDRHHNVSTFLQMGIKEVYGFYMADLSLLSQEDFIKVMILCKWTWLYDNQAHKKDFKDLPNHLTKLMNDPYRSLMYLLREEKVLNKDESVPFIEFYWAQEIRKHIVNLNSDNESLKKAYHQVIALIVSNQLHIKDCDLNKAKEIYEQK